MKLTPLEIRKQEFRKTMRGLDPIEVQTFLDMVSDQYEQILEENKENNRKLIELETRLRSYQENEKTLRDTLVNMQEVKKQSEETSRRQADLHIKEAELKALEIIEKVHKEKRLIQEEVNWLKSQKASFINRIRHVLISQIELLSVMQIDDELPDETKSKLDAWRKGRGLKTRSDKGAVVLPDTNAPDDTTDDGEELNSPENASNATKAGSSGKSRAEDVIAGSKHADDTDLTDEDIDNFFKKGLQIDDLIKTINKRELDK